MNSNVLPSLCDGRAIAREILDGLKNQVAGLATTPTLSVILVGSDPASKSYVRLKMRKAKYVGIAVNLFEFPEDACETEILETIDAEVTRKHSIIVQLPLPSGIDAQKILNRVPPHLDVDILSDSAKALFAKGELDIDQPVVGSMKAILAYGCVAIERKKVVIIGDGALVGKPAAAWFRLQGADVVVVDEQTRNISEVTKSADIIACGAGVPGLLVPDMIKPGVIILDAGTSEDSGVLKGDADPACANKASLFTPVPGGIGPITVAVLLRNVVESV